MNSSICIILTKHLHNYEQICHLIGLHVQQQSDASFGDSRFALRSNQSSTSPPKDASIISYLVSRSKPYDCPSYRILFYLLYPRPRCCPCCAALLMLRLALLLLLPFHDPPCISLAG